MPQRSKYYEVSPDTFKAMMGVAKAAGSASIPANLHHMVELRASQINGCAYCVDMHWKQAKAAGESEQRLYMLSAWRESSLYSPREQAALAWTEAVTKVNQSHPEDELYEQLKAQFSEKEIVDLTWIIATINTWNRIAISFQATPASEIKTQH